MISFFFIDNIFIEFGGLLFRQVIGIPMDTNCDPLLAYESQFRQGYLNNKDRTLGPTFDSCIHYIDDVPSQNNSQYSNYLHLIYQNQLEVKNTLMSPSYLDLHIEIDKFDDFILPIVNFPFINSITSVWSLYFTTHTCAQ